jgi:hypothetical protein
VRLSERRRLTRFPAGKYPDRGAERFLIPTAGMSESGQITISRIGRVDLELDPWRQFLGGQVRLVTARIGRHLRRTQIGLRLRCHQRSMSSELSSKSPTRNLPSTTLAGAAGGAGGASLGAGAAAGFGAPGFASGARSDRGCQVGLLF